MPAATAPEDSAAPPTERERDADAPESSLDRADEEGANSAAEPGHSREGAPAEGAELGTRFEQFGEALEAADCDAAEHFRDRVCQLAERLCELSRDLPSSSRAHGDCADGRDRCQQASRRYAERCP